jgi:hypothetical protein
MRTMTAFIVAGRAGGRIALPLGVRVPVCVVRSLQHPYNPVSDGTERDRYDRAEKGTE